MTGTWSEQYSGRRLDFALGTYRCFVIMPMQERRHVVHPWVWYHHTFLGPHPHNPSVNPTRSLHPDDSHAWLLGHLLAAGFWVAGIEVGESFGNPQGRAAQTSFYRFAVRQFELAPQACLLAQSRGGLMHYNWAVEHPEWVRCVGGIYPVTDMRTWPPRPGKEFDMACVAYGVTATQFDGILPQHNPVDRLAPLAALSVPVLHVHGVDDVVVPIAQNTLEFARQYQALGGAMEIATVPGKGHEACPEIFEHPSLLAFFLRQA